MGFILRTFITLILGPCVSKAINRSIAIIFSKVFSVYTQNLLRELIEFDELWGYWIYLSLMFSLCALYWA